MSQEGFTPVTQTPATVTRLFSVGFYCIFQPTFKVFLILLQQQKLTQDDICLYKTWT